MKLTADLKSCIVKVTPVGVNPSGVNGYSLKHNVQYTLKHKDRLEILLEQFVHEIIFDPEPEYAKKDGKILNQQSSEAKKRRNDDSFNDKDLQNKCIKLEARTQKFNKWEEVDDKNLYVFTSDGVRSGEKVSFRNFTNCLFMKNN